MKTFTLSRKGRRGDPSGARGGNGKRRGEQAGPVIRDIEASFGLIRARRSASLEEIERAIPGRGFSCPGGDGGQPRGLN